MRPPSSETQAPKRPGTFRLDNRLGRVTGVADATVGDGLEKAETAFRDEIAKGTGRARPDRLAATLRATPRPTWPPDAARDGRRGPPRRFSATGGRPSSVAPHVSEDVPCLEDRPANAGQVPVVPACPCPSGHTDRPTGRVGGRTTASATVPRRPARPPNKVPPRQEEDVGHLAGLSDTVAVPLGRPPSIGVDAVGPKVARHLCRPREGLAAGLGGLRPPSDGGPTETPSASRDPVRRDADRGGVPAPKADHLRGLRRAMKVNTTARVAGEGTKTLDDAVGTAFVLSPPTGDPFPRPSAEVVTVGALGPSPAVVTSPRPYGLGTPVLVRPTVADRPVLLVRQTETVGPWPVDRRDVDGSVVAPDVAVGTVTLVASDRRQTVRAPTGDTDGNGRDGRAPRLSPILDADGTVTKPIPVVGVPADRRRPAPPGVVVGVVGPSVDRHRRPMGRMVRRPARVTARLS